MVLDLMLAGAAQFVLWGGMMSIFSTVANDRFQALKDAIPVYPRMQGYYINYYSQRLGLGDKR